MSYSDYMNCICPRCRHNYLEFEQIGPICKDCGEVILFADPALDLHLLMRGLRYTIQVHRGQCACNRKQYVCPRFSLTCGNCRHKYDWYPIWFRNTDGLDPKTLCDDKGIPRHQLAR